MVRITSWIYLKPTQPLRFHLFIMIHFTYVIFSISSNKYYTGSSHNPQLRLKLHNDGATKSTKSGIPWTIVYIETHPDKTSALKREKEIKKKKSRKYIEEM